MNFGMPGGNENGLSLPIMASHHAMTGGGGDQRDVYGCMSRPTYDTSPPLAIGGAPGYLRPAVSPTSNGSSPPAHHAAAAAAAAAAAYHHHPTSINGHHPHPHPHHAHHHQYNMNGSNSTGKLNNNKNGVVKQNYVSRKPETKLRV